MTLTKTECKALLVLAACMALLGATGSLRWDQLNAVFIHGTSGYGQASDNTGTSGDLAKFNSNGSVTNGPGLQGTDSNVLTAGTVSGTSVVLCTDANGGATTASCPSAAVHGLGMAWGQSGGTVLATGTTSYASPFTCTIGSTWYAYSDQTITFDVLVGGSSITASAPPTAAGSSNSGSTSTWSRSISTGSTLGFKIASATGSPTIASVVLTCQ